MMFAPILGGLALSILAGPLGCFIVWRRMAYFGDGLAHSALLGIAVGLVSGVHNSLGIIAVSLLFIIGFSWLQSQVVLATDTLLGIVTHAALALGVLILTLSNAGEADVHGYFLGRIEYINFETAFGLCAGAIIGLATLLPLWEGLILISADSSIATAEGIPVKKYNFILMLLMALTVALAVNIVGIFLITALLIIPAATARIIAQSPRQMAILASGYAAFAITSTLFILNTLMPEIARHTSATRLESGPVIVLILIGLFLLTLAGQHFKKHFYRLINPNR